ncbi:hypothetical protein BN3589_01014 [Clostridium sp. C105KSO14]|jgi:hypothetical protein|nr:hypothetical protein BN3589_01014 [Clostridium sp. C105KSO14]
MPMQRDMNFSIRWKQRAGESMGEKKNRERFSIKFNQKEGLIPRSLLRNKLFQDMEEEIY